MWKRGKNEDSCFKTAWLLQSHNFKLVLLVTETFGGSLFHLSMSRSEIKCVSEGDGNIQFKKTNPIPKGIFSSKLS